MGDGNFYVLLDDFTLTAGNVNDYVLEATLENASVSASLSIDISGGTDLVLADTKYLQINYAEIIQTLDDARVKNTIIGTLEHTLGRLISSSSGKLLGATLSRTLERVTLSSSGASSGNVLVKVLGNVSISSIGNTRGGSSQISLDNFTLSSVGIGTLSADLGLTLSDVGLSITSKVLLKGQASTPLDEIGALSSEGLVNISGDVQQIIELSSVSSVGNLPIEAVGEPSFGNALAIGNGFTATTYSPFQQIVTWSGHPASGQSVKTRLGNLVGITGRAGEFGLWAGTGWQGTLQDHDRYLIASNLGLEAHNIDITLYEGTSPTIKLAQDIPSIALGNPLPTGFNTNTGIWMGNDSGAYKLRVGDPENARLEWTGSSLDIFGATLTLTQGLNTVIKLDPTIPSFAIGNPAPTAFDGLDSGLWTGIDGVEGYKFRLGDPSGARLEWISPYGGDEGKLNLVGTSLKFDGPEGAIILTQATLEKVGGSFTGSGVWIDSDGIWGINSSEVQAYIDSSSGELKAAAGTITLNSSGISMLGGTFRAGQASTFTEGKGVWIGELPADLLVTYEEGYPIYTEGTTLGYQGTTDESRLAIGGGWAFRIGDPDGDRLEWDGLSLSLFAPTINLVESTIMGNPTIYFKKSDNSPILTLQAEVTTGLSPDKVIAELLVSSYNTLGTELIIGAEMIEFSSVPFLPSNPTQNLQAVTKQYVDGLIVTDHGALSGLSDDDHPQYVKNTENETIRGVKTFSSIPVLPGWNPVKNNQAARKAYVDSLNKDLIYLKAYYYDEDIEIINGAIYFTVPSYLNGATVISVGSKVYTGTATATLYNVTKAETVIATKTFATGDVLRVDVSAASGQGLDYWCEVRLA